jgi:hypothetical protein
LTSDEFNFEVPPGWTHSPDAARITFTDGRGGVLLVSSSRILAAEAASDLDAALAEAFATVRRAASDRSLEQIAELHESSHRNLRCWTGEAQPRDGSVLFSQCVMASRRGVLFATLETPPPEQSHREKFQTFVRSVFSSELRSLLRRVRRTAPTCVADAAPRLDSDSEAEQEPERPDTEQFSTSFWLGCPCGSRKTAVLGHPMRNGQETLISAPIELLCCACNQITEIFDPDRHGYNAELCVGSDLPRDPSVCQRYPCSNCGKSVGEAIATFMFNDPESLQTLPPELVGREQDTFDWFTLEWRCDACKELCYITDYELA